MGDAEFAPYHSFGVGAFEDRELLFLAGPWPDPGFRLYQNATSFGMHVYDFNGAIVTSLDSFSELRCTIYVPSYAQDWSDQIPNSHFLWLRSTIPTHIPQVSIPPLSIFAKANPKT